jgi:hypothetical protein
MWAILLIFLRYMLPTSSGLKCVSRCLHIYNVLETTGEGVGRAWGLVLCLCKYRQWIENVVQKALGVQTWSHQQLFSSGNPSKCLPGITLLNFSFFLLWVKKRGEWSLSTLLDPQKKEGKKGGKKKAFTRLKIAQYYSMALSQSTWKFSFIYSVCLNPEWKFTAATAAAIYWWWIRTERIGLSKLSHLCYENLGSTEEQGMLIMLMFVAWLKLIWNQIFIHFSLFSSIQIFLFTASKSKYDFALVLAWVSS